MERVLTVLHYLIDNVTRHHRIHPIAAQLPHRLPNPFVRIVHTSSTSLLSSSRDISSLPVLPHKRLSSLFSPSTLISASWTSTLMSASSSSSSSTLTSPPSPLCK